MRARRESISFSAQHSKRRMSGRGQHSLIAGSCFWRSYRGSPCTSRPDQAGSFSGRNQRKKRSERRLILNQAAEPFAWGAGLAESALAAFKTDGSILYFEMIAFGPFLFRVRSILAEIRRRTQRFSSSRKTRRSTRLIWNLRFVTLWEWET